MPLTSATCRSAIPQTVAFRSSTWPAPQSDEPSDHPTGSRPITETALKPAGYGTELSVSVGDKRANKNAGAKKATCAPLNRVSNNEMLFRKVPPAQPSCWIDVKRRSYPLIQPKYCNPEDSSETWTGRGNQPRWGSDAASFGKATCQDR